MGVAHGHGRGSWSWAWRMFMDVAHGHGRDTELVRAQWYAVSTHLCCPLLL